MMLDALDAVAMRPAEIDLSEKLGVLAKHFESSVEPKEGYFGARTIDMGNGLSKTLGRDLDGHRTIDYLRDGKPYKRRTCLGNHRFETVEFDDKGTDYLRTIQSLSKDGRTTIDMRLKPDSTVMKGNFTAKTDRYGRPVFNQMEDLQLREPSVSRQNLSEKLRDASYRADDHRGHIIADEFGGPASKENVVAQLDKVNQVKMREVERTVKNLKKEGHRVDYSVKTNYAGSDIRPSSFEASIVVDGEPYELPDNVKNIYNDEINDTSIRSAVKRASVNVQERFGLAHEEGLRSASLAAAITCSVSSYENISAFVDGDLTAEEMVGNIVGDTAVAGGAAYGAAFITETVQQGMAASSNKLISSVGGSSAPALAVSFGVQSFKDITDFAQGKIDGGELAYNLGENAAEVGGGAVGGAIVGAKVGAIAGTVAGPAGAAVGGAAGSIIGGVVGCAVASEAYASAVELGTEGVGALGEQVENLATTTIDAVSESVPELTDSVRGSFNDYFQQNHLPFSV